MRDRTDLFSAREARSTSPGLWTALAIFYCAAVVGALAYGLWREPFPIREVIRNVQLASSYGPLEIFWESLSHQLEGAYLRPFYWSILSLVITVLGNSEQAIFTFELLHILNIAALLFWLVWFLRPASAGGCLAVMVAVACFAGMPSFRANLENLPLNHDYIILLLAFVTLSLLKAPHRPANDIAAALVCLLAPLVKEPGLIVPVVLVTGFAVGFRGVSRRSLFAASGILVAYVAYRIFHSAELPLFKREIGLFFSSYSLEEATAAFGSNPYPVYLYNVIATGLNTLFSEPSDGRFVAIQALLEGRARPWQILSLAVSAASTILVFSWGLVRLSASLRGSPNHEARLFLLFLAVLSVSSLLGYNYTRDRFGGIAGGFYALCLSLAVRWALDLALDERRSWQTFAALVACLFLVSTLWQMRTVSSLVALRQSAWESRKEWIYHFDSRVAKYERNQDPVGLETLRLYGKQGLDPTIPATNDDPRWLEAYFGYKL